MTDPAESKGTAAPSEPRAASWGGRDRLLVGSNVAVMIVVAVAIYVAVNFVSFHKYGQLDWTASKMNTVSPDTASLLESLDQDVQVTALFRPQSRIDDELMPLVNNLLARYAAISDRVKVENIDVDMDLERAKLVIAQHSLSAANVIVFSVGDKKKVVQLADAAEIEYGGGSPFGGGQPDRLRGFKGEELFSSAIREVTEERQQTVYFLAGHGELALDDFDEPGLSEFAKRLKRDNYKVESLNLLAPPAGREKGMPSDCDVLVVAAPSKDASGEELDEIRRYLGNGGKLLLLGEALQESNLLSVVTEYGVTFDPEPRVLIDLAPNRHNPYSGPMSLVASDNFAFDHEITKAFRDQGACFFSIVRPLGVGAAEAGASVTKLVSTSPDESMTKKVVDGRIEPRQTPDDQPGPHCYAAAIEKKGAAENAPPTRIVVFGDSEFVANGPPYASTRGIAAAYNEELISNAIDWLAEKQAYFDIAPKTTDERRITLSGEVETKILLYAVFAMPLLLGIVLGGAVWFVRRR